MDRKERILAYITSKEYIPLKYDELKIVLDVPEEADAEFSMILSKLCREGKICLTKKDRYAPVGKSTNSVSGVLRCSAKGFFGFVICDDEAMEDIFVSGDEMHGALDGDRVIVKILSGDARDAHKNGRITKIIERANKTVVGVAISRKKGVLCVQADNRKIYELIRINEENSMEAIIGDRVAVEITDYAANGTIWGRVLSILGGSDSLKSCIEGVILESGVKSEFSPETLSHAQEIQNHVSEKDTEGRLDLREKLIFTIDGDTARDFDDAVSVDMLENGNYYLGVHIADVSHYVTKNSPLDKEALLRGTSIYLADRVIPMLPEKLSNGICSLNPNEDRLTLSVFMEINRDGAVINHSIEKSVICSKERMTYNIVTAMLEGEEYPAQYEYLMPTLEKMRELAKILSDKRQRRGAIQFEFPETAVLVDENGEPIEIGREQRGISNGIIEEFMLCANETVAEYAFWADLPFIYRIHEQPSTEKITAFNEFIRNFGLLIKGGKDGEIHPKSLQQILDSVTGTPEERMVASKMLRSLMKAEYNTENKGHFGLAAKYYCHFTSPIRRYPDLAIHRILKEFISGKELECGDINKVAKHSSDCEITAEGMERSVEDLMKTAYMSNHIGECFEGVVSGVTRFGMFVELENSIEGLVRVENMSGDYYEYDEDNAVLLGVRTGKSYRIGDGVEIAVAHTDILSRQIDFVLRSDLNRQTFRKFDKKPVYKIKNNVQMKKFVRKKKR